MCRVTVVTPLYNAAKFIDQTVRSVLMQTHGDWELMLIDDCSTDNSFELARSYQVKDRRIKVFRLEKNSGAAAARNLGIKKASGRFIAFLDSDDVWSPEKLEKQVFFMLNNNVEFSYTAYEKINEKGEMLFKVGVPAKVSYKGLLKTCVIGCLTAMYDTHKVGKVYMPENTRREDYATWLEILRRVGSAHGINEPLAQYRVYAGQSSAKKANMAVENWRLYRELEGLNVFQ